MTADYKINYVLNQSPLPQSNEFHKHSPPTLGLSDNDLLLLLSRNNPLE